ncbi:signal peptide peptidase SppA [Roseomonas sp. OT10]|uniref:signal peptide peptidase SppA n=1 Tax=Roseomonas cutis TaxID=2897332 RepID=UPI001E506FF4|nr:signal peptide peptidase SppA [Roseomonas sp. OT10]UFN51242.1 signal peptide peptidase SppA [Roseomonas sp. OT10]
MALDPDALIDRRRLKRSRALWRALAVLSVLGVLAVALAPAELPSLGASPVARLTVRGTITDDRRVIEAVDEAARDAETRALVVAIDSPGGTLAGGEGLHAALTRFREAGKPVVAVMGGTAASAGYMIALPAERIFARDSTLTGSIGVLLQSFNVQELMSRIGVEAVTLASGPLKAQPSPFAPLSEEGRRVLEGVLQDMQSRFVALVAQGRKLPEERVRELADGRVYSGRQALGVGLIDAIGGEREARAFLAAQHGIAERTEARELETTGRSRLSRLVVSLAQTVVSEGLAQLGLVDGAAALWQPVAR